MKRLYDCAPLDPANLTYRAPAGCIEAVFDGDVMLEERDGVRIDHIEGRIKLRYAPAYQVRALVSIEPDFSELEEHARNTLEAVRRSFATAA